MVRWYCCYILNYSLLFFLVTGMYDYVFSENGLVAYKDGKLIGKQVSVIDLTHDIVIVL